MVWKKVEEYYKTVISVLTFAILVAITVCGFIVSDVKGTSRERVENLSEEFSDHCVTAENKVKLVQHNKESIIKIDTKLTAIEKKQDDMSALQKEIRDDIKYIIRKNGG